MFHQFPFSSQIVTVTPPENLKKHHDKEIYFTSIDKGHIKTPTTAKQKTKIYVQQETLQKA